MKLAFLLQFISRWKTHQSCDLGRAVGGATSMWVSNVFVYWRLRDVGHVSS